MNYSQRPKTNPKIISKVHQPNNDEITATSIPIDTIPFSPEHINYSWSNGPQATVSRSPSELQFINDRNRTYRRIADPLEVPERTYPFTESIYNRVINYQPKMAVNIPTRGVETYFQPIGVLTSTMNPNRVLQLYGRAIYPGSNKWQYYTNTDAFQSVKVTIRHNRRDCLNELGCDQIFQGDIVEVPAYHGETFRVELYNIDKPRYISYLV
jgi:hypothetical protein